MSEPMAQAVHRATRNGVHVALVDKLGKDGDLPQILAQPEGVRADFATEDALIAAVDDYTDGRVFDGERETRTTILVCTDSRRDACCARYGFSTYKALAAIADPEQFNIVQATHLGGCRFAASLMVMPQRQRYGRMTAGQAPAFLEALSRGEVFLPAFKGRADTPEPLQVAELAALRWAQSQRRDAGAVDFETTEVPEDPVEGSALTIHVRVGGDNLAIGLRARLFHVQGHCGIVAENGGQHTIRWCFETLTPTPFNEQHKEIS